MAHTSRTVSVIIPFFGRSTQQLTRCVKALKSQSYPCSLLEIVVVDNHADRRLDHSILGLGDVVIVHQPVPGSYAARNAGVGASTGELLAFTDSDCVPAVDWVAQGVAAISDAPALSAIGGAIEVTFCRDEAPGLLEELDRAVHLRQTRYVGFGFAATANLFTSKRTFVTVGPFDDRFMSGGDHDWCMRLGALGGRILFAAPPKVFHPARNTFFTLLVKNLRGVGGQYIKLRQSPSTRLRLFSQQRTTFRDRLLLFRSYADSKNLSILRRLCGEFVLVLIYGFRCIETARLVLGGRPIRF